jgi:hypothetical protein
LQADELVESSIPGGEDVINKNIINRIALHNFFQVILAVFHLLLDDSISFEISRVIPA